MLAYWGAATTHAASCESDKAAVVSGRIVVFFAPSQTEYDRLIGDARDAATEALSDFLVYSQRLGEYLNGRGISHFMTSAERVEVRRAGQEPVCFVRSHTGDQFGAILSDGQSVPQVILGVITDEDAIPVVERYFSTR
ncbi:MAG: hypothetical protein WC713_13455 [Candidatus Methylomirabilota bacterium]